MCIYNHAHAHTHTHIMFHFVRKLPPRANAFQFFQSAPAGDALNSSGVAPFSFGDVRSSDVAFLSNGRVHFLLPNDVCRKVTSSPSTLFELSALHCLVVWFSRRLYAGPPTSSTCQQLSLLVILIVTRNHWKQATQTQAEATQAKRGRKRETEKAFSSLSLEYKKLLPHIFTAVDHTACPTTPRTSRTILHTVCHFPRKPQMASMFLVF